MSEEVELKISISKSVYDKISGLAEALKTKPEDLVKTMLEVLADYTSEVSRLGASLAVSDEKRATSTFEELLYYGVESWRSLVEVLLDILGAKGCYELESIDFEPLEPLLEIEMVALEGCKFKADRLVVSWSTKGVMVEVFYYLESRPKPAPQVSLAYEWSYLPDEHAVVVSVTGSSIAEIPRIEVIDREAEKLGL